MLAIGPVKDNLLNIKNLISQYEIKYHRRANSVHLLCASKGQSIEKMRMAIEAGQRCFGENYLQEALEKMTALQDYPIEWHFIGPIQSNKIKKIATHFSWVESIDQEETALKLNQLRPDHLPPLECLIEVNICGEKTKSGVHPDKLVALANYIKTLPKLRLRGLMAIPAPVNSFEAQREEFKKLFLLMKKLNDQHFDLDILSMGMSDDFEAAIAEGSTLIRIGTAIFGPRA